ncbi:MAG: hypothetical protein JO359_11870 [Candidatus Eremiobacteraeota bacterium]|nr:hypothetical protein [Candidatus Eremiobacteraeota bacterium]
MPDDRPDFPLENLRAAVPGNPGAQAEIDALHRELAAERPASAKIKAHVESLQKHAPLSTLVANWFEDPRTQTFIQELTAAGL